MEEKSSRKERRKEARSVRNKKKFDSWIHNRQSKISKLESKSDKAGKRLKNNEIDDSSSQPEMVGISKTETRDRKTIEATGNTRPLRNSEAKKEFKRKRSSDKTSKPNFFNLLDMQTNGMMASAEEDLRLERRLAKKLKLKSGRLTNANDDLDMLLEGIPSMADSLGNVGKENKKARDNKSKTIKMDSAYEDLDDEISSGEGSEESNLVTSDDELENVMSPEDSPISSGEASEEADSLNTDQEHEDADLAPGDPKKNLQTSRLLEEHDESSSSEQEVDTRISSNTEASGPPKAVSSEVALDKLPNKGAGKYVAPHLRSRGGNESAEYAEERRRLRGLLNRLSETNVESITGEISALFQSVGRAVGTQIVTEEIVTSCSGGPRGNEQYAAVFASFVAGMASLVGIDFGAKLLSRLANRFEEEYMKEDNLSLRNLTLLLSHLFVFGVCSSELIYDFLIMLGKRLTEVDVSTILTVLQCCGMKLRGDDPVGMKNFIHSIQSRVTELKASADSGKSNISSKRMEFMIETIFDIKNNKKRSKEETVQHTHIKKWLQKLRVDDILIRGLKWSKLLDPNKKGQWWLSGDIASTVENVEEVAGTIDKEIPETKKMLQLAASMRMNTSARNAIFCVIMSGEDYIDAFEKLLGLDLPGKQDREIMRVLVECCLQEKVFNEYYCILASKLCSHDKNHKFTLQYCLWDHFKELESMTLLRSMHLAKFTARMIENFSLSLAVLKAVDLSDPANLTSKRIMHFRMLFEAIFEFSDKKVWNIFTRIAVTPEYEALRSGIELFISKYVVSSQKSLGSKFKIAKKALNNIEGLVM
ncbi:nucleolar MIF4G domain-containing protein 1 [Salvia hispanica]|uniref:nucleolar MIF4G domain-containing protein 1 n=1 Tax=Salvia hispanica TaxID=49212 RepID=UPI0020095012|nr:nucleolar MIF4G domain-containing protein 1 [Salvia hispanica]